MSVSPESWLTVIDMDDATGKADDGYAELRTAPEHVIDMLLAVMRPYGGPAGHPGEVSYARAARAEAKIYADRIWAEAAAAGAAWGLARNTQPIRIDLPTERLAELMRREDG